MSNYWWTIRIAGSILGLKGTINYDFPLKQFCAKCDDNHVIDTKFYNYQLRKSNFKFGWFFQSNYKILFSKPMFQ